MRKREFYNYGNPKFSFMRDIMRKVMKTYGNAERFFATIKEITWAKLGLKGLTDYIHKLEHIQPERVDIFKDIMAEIGLEVEYPPSDELDTSEITNLSKVFEISVEVINSIDEALREFITEIDTNHKEFSAIAREAENLLVVNSKDRKSLLEAWDMADNETSLTSFDSWIKTVL